jgi:hypothetical protein
MSIENKHSDSHGLGAGQHSKDTQGSLHRVSIHLPLPTLRSNKEQAKFSSNTQASGLGWTFILNNKIQTNKRSIE